VYPELPITRAKRSGTFEAASTAIALDAKPSAKLTVARRAGQPSQQHRKDSKVKHSNVTILPEAIRVRRRLLPINPRQERQNLLIMNSFLSLTAIALTAETPVGSGPKLVVPPTFQRRNVDTRALHPQQISLTI